MQEFRVIVKLSKAESDAWRTRAIQHLKEESQLRGLDHLTKWYQRNLQAISVIYTALGAWDEGDLPAKHPNEEEMVQAWDDRHA